MINRTNVISKIKLLHTCTFYFGNTLENKRHVVLNDLPIRVCSPMDGDELYTRRCKCRYESDLDSFAP